MHTFSAALKKASREKPIELLALMVAALALLIAAVTAYFLWAQLRSLDKTLESQNDLLESQAYNYIDNGLAELDKLFVANAKFRIYFQQNAEMPSNPDDRLTVLALADAQLDFMDGFFSQENHINWTRYTKPGWLAYFKTSFRCSPALRFAFCGHIDEYGKSLRDFAEQSFPPAGLCDNGKPRPLVNQPACEQ